jgi:hypothetical protein
MTMAHDFYSAVKARRSVYGISKDPVISDRRIVEIVEEAVKHSPSAFNSQSGRVVVLLGEHHNKLWEALREILRKIVPADKFKPTDEKISSFKAGYGTVLVFEDQDVIKGLQENYPAYKDAFPTFSLHSSGMLQYVIWTSLAVEGLGASLQHYSPLIDEFIAKEWNIPASWKLQSQIPFGKQTSQNPEKQFSPIESRVKVFGK